MEQIFFEDRALIFIDRNDPALPGTDTFPYKGLQNIVDFALGEFRSLSHYAQVCVNCGSESAQEIFSKFCHQIGIVESAGGLVRAPDPLTGEATYLYIYRNKTWDLPKGKREKGESPVVNALREVQEETGLQQLKALRFIRNTYHFIGGNPMAPPPNCGPVMVKQVAWFEMEVPAQQTPTPQAEEGIEQAAWLTPAQIIEKLPLMYASIAYLSNEFFAEQTDN